MKIIRVVAVLLVVAVLTPPAGAKKRIAQSVAVLAGTEAAYIGHTGANDGKGGITAGTKDGELDKEQRMGLRWTWLPVHWSLLEPEDPRVVGDYKDPAWLGIDHAIELAQARGLNVLVQPAVGGNAGAPPAWAGRRHAQDGSTDSSAPACMDCLVDFMGRLARRYAPGGTLAVAKGWSMFGVRYWEMDNEPDAYLTNWHKVADDYAEFVVKSAARIKSIDSNATIVGPSLGGANDAAVLFLNQILASGAQAASTEYVANGIDYVAGPSIDVASFHSYELLEMAFSPDFDLLGGDLATRYLKRDITRVRQAFDTYAPKTRFWHTEGSFGYIADDPEGKRNWVAQWLTRGFAMGIEKMVIMDASDDEIVTMQQMTRLFRQPSSMTDVTATLGYDPNNLAVFRNGSPCGTYVAWADTRNRAFAPAVVLPVCSATPKLVTRAGVETPLTPVGGKVTVLLPITGAPFNEPVFVVN